jgi:hypothetical protein
VLAGGRVARCYPPATACLYETQHLGTQRLSHAGTVVNDDDADTYGSRAQKNRITRKHDSQYNGLSPVFRPALQILKTPKAKEKRTNTKQETPS